MVRSDREIFGTIWQKHNPPKNVPGGLNPNAASGGPLYVPYMGSKKHIATSPIVSAPILWNEAILRLPLALVMRVSYQNGNTPLFYIPIAIRDALRLGASLPPIACLKCDGVFWPKVRTEIQNSSELSQKTKNRIAR